MTFMWRNINDDTPNIEQTIWIIQLVEKFYFNQYNISRGPNEMKHMNLLLAARKQTKTYQRTYFK